jgi:hypothetical protein
VALLPSPAAAVVGTAARMTNPQTTNTPPVSVISPNGRPVNGSVAEAGTDAAALVRPNDATPHAGQPIDNS